MQYAALFDVIVSCFPAIIGNASDWMGHSDGLIHYFTWLPEQWNGQQSGSYMILMFVLNVQYANLFGSKPDPLCTFIIALLYEKVCWMRMKQNYTDIFRNTIVYLWS